MADRRVSVAITTRDRPASLERCLSSLDRIADLVSEVLVFDDGSNPPVQVPMGRTGVRLLRDPRAPGYIVGRNALMAAATSAFVLLLDDDAAIMDGGAIAQALDVMVRDPAVAAIGFAQANADGTPWAEAMQPARGHQPRCVPSYIGFAHLLRRDVFQRLGGYRESLVQFGEEKDYCLRLLDRGLKVVYLPQALVLHVPDPASRDRRRYLRFVARNDLLLAFYNEPMPRLAWMVPLRFARYFRMRRGWNIPDPFGWWWVLTDAARTALRTRQSRAPVSRRTLAAWRRLRDEVVPYPDGDAAA